MLKDVPINYQLHRNWSMVLLVKTNVGARMLSISKPTSKVLLEMCFSPVSLSHILEPSQPNWDIGSGKKAGYPTFPKNKSPWPKESNPSSSSPLKPSRPSGKTKAFLKITWVSKTPPSYRHAQDGLFWSILSFRAPTGSEDPRETTFPPSASTKNTGWDNSPKTSLKEEPSSLKESRKK